MKPASLKPRVSWVNTSIAAPLPQSLGFNDARRGSAASRGYGSEWRKLRGLILKRDAYQCQECKRQGRLQPADCVDHIVNKARGGDDSKSNLQALCNACHLAKTRGEAGQG